MVAFGLQVNYSAPMPRFIALTSRGCVDVLLEELQSMGLENLQKTPGGCFFEGPWAHAYRVNLQSRIATRVLLTILDFSAYNQDDLYNNIRKHDFTKYIDPSQTIAVESSTSSEIFRDQRFVALKVKDAIVDQFREKYDVRPDVDSKNADFVINVRVQGSSVSVGLDTSGSALFRRGYREERVDAPLKEYLAASLLRMTGWNGEVPLVDPMCGSGTILIEAALQGLGISPGTLRRRFAVQKWKVFQREAWEQETASALATEKEFPPGLLFGSDIDRKAVSAAKTNARAADVADLISFSTNGVDMISPPEGPPGIVIVNPPYGERLGELDLLKDSYRDLGFTLKTKFKGWTAWVLSGDPELPGLMGLKSTRRIPVFNGPIECRFLKYEIRN